MATKVVDLRAQGGTEATAKLPPTKTVLHVEYTDGNGQVFGGDFTVHRLNIGEISRVGVRRAQLNGGLSSEALDDQLQTLHAMLAHLELAVENGPEWWKPSTFYDIEPIMVVYDAVMGFEETFRRPAQRPATPSAPDSQGQSRSADGVAPQVVDSKVQAPPHA